MSYDEFDGCYGDYDDGYGYDDFDDVYDDDLFDSRYDYIDNDFDDYCEHDDYNDFDNIYDDDHFDYRYNDFDDLEGYCNQFSKVHITPGLQTINSKKKETENTSVKIQGKIIKQTSKEIIKKENEKVKNEMCQLLSNPNLLAHPVWNFNCKHCYQGICKSTDIRLAENIYHIVINTECFSSMIAVFVNPNTCQIKCSNCSSVLGTQRTYKERLFPTLKIDCFRLVYEDDTSSSRLFKKWKDVPFQIAVITQSELSNFTKIHSLSYCLTAKNQEDKEFTTKCGKSIVEESIKEVKAVNITSQAERNIRKEIAENDLEYKKTLKKVQDTSKDQITKEIKKCQFGKEWQKTVVNFGQQSTATLTPPTPLWNFDCKTCSQNICKSTDIRVASNIHHIIINTECFSSMRTEIVNQNTCQIKCNNCSSFLGHRQSYIGCLFPTIKIQAFSLACETGSKHYKKWKDVPLQIPAITSAELLNFNRNHSLCN